HLGFLEDVVRLRAADAVDVRQADLDPLVERQIHSRDSRHVCPLTLSLLVLGDRADDPDDAVSPDDLALHADSLDRCPDFHDRLLLVPVNNPPPRQIVRRQLHEHLVAREDPDEVLPHLPRYVREHLMFVLQLHLEHPVRQRLDNRRHYLDRIFLRHAGTAVASRAVNARSRPRPRITGPSAPIPLVFSKCADALRSRVRTVQPSESTETSPPPRLNMGSIARTIPGVRRLPRPPPEPCAGRIDSPAAPMSDTRPPGRAAAIPA